LKNLEHDSREALMICAADKIHNLTSMMDAHQELGEKLWDHFNAPKSQKLWLYGEIMNVLKRRLKNPIVKELGKTFRQAIKTFMKPLEKNLK
jgi:hypothetical protein